jgi:hypothetical protein
MVAARRGAELRIWVLRAWYPTYGLGQTPHASHVASRLGDAALALGRRRGGLCAVSPALGCGAGRSVGRRGMLRRRLTGDVLHRHYPACQGDDGAGPVVLPACPLKRASAEAGGDRVQYPLPCR